MLTFAEFFAEAEAATSHYSWYDHPLHGPIITRGADKHHELRDRYDFEDKHDAVPRGSLKVDHHNKKVELLHYGWTNKPTTDHIINHLRQHIAAPHNYTNAERSW